MRYYIGAEESHSQRTPMISRRAAGVVVAGGKLPAGRFHAVPQGKEVAVCGKTGLAYFEEWDFEATAGDKCPACLERAK